MQALKAIVMLALMELKISECERRRLKDPVPKTTTDAFLEVSSVKCDESNNYCGVISISSSERGIWYGHLLYPKMTRPRKPPKRKPKPPPKKDQQNQNKSTTKKTSIPTTPTTTAPTTTAATSTTTATATTTTVGCIRTAISYDECINYEGDQSTLKNSIPEATTESFNIVPFQDHNKYCGRFQLNVFHVGLWQELYLFPNATKIFAEKRRRHMPPTKKKKKKIYPNLKGKPHWPR